MFYVVGYFCMNYEYTMMHGPININIKNEDTFSSSEDHMRKTVRHRATLRNIQHGRIRKLIEIKHFID
jgi:hypothetical protein